ncbi:trace amine-associated receptor 13c-like [Nothobranchius furzeri]|uniref:trace amine-associated receptor 13c-like n=1 Tax=Nothobranchius furzeri TaxID=105023 RepID=UPI003904DBD6
MEVLDTDFCFPQLSNSSCRKPALPRVTAVFLSFFLSFICVFTVALNLLVIISVSHFRKLHNTTNFLLLSLAISDFMVGLVFLPGEIVRLTACWFLGDYMCLLYLYIISFTVSASIGNIVIISADRFVAICDPLHYHTRVTVKRTQACICLLWLYSMLYNITFVKDVLRDRHNSCNGECVFVNDNFTVLLDLVLNFFVPVTVIIVLYMRVFYKAVIHPRAIRFHITAVTLKHSMTPSATKSELKAARTLGVLVVVFLTCFCPYYCAGLVTGSSFNASVVALCFFSINSCLNPVIYALFYPWFRKSVRHIVTFKILQPGSSEANVT